MCKKIVLTVLGIGVTAGIFLGEDAFSYLSTACNRATDGVQESIPVSFQIDRARQLVKELDPEVRRSMQVIAREEIALERVKEQIDKASKQADESKTNIIRLQSDLQSSNRHFTYVGHTFSRQEVTEDLSRRFERHKVHDETLSHLTKMRDAREKNLDAARQKLTAMIAAKNQLEADIVNLEAKQKLVTVAQASSDLMLDDSQLARAKGLVADIRSRLDVAARLANTDTEYPMEIQLDPAASDDVTEQVAAYFGIGDDDTKIASSVEPNASLASITLD